MEKEAMDWNAVNEDLLEAMFDGEDVMENYKRAGRVITGKGRLSLRGVIVERFGYLETLVARVQRAEKREANGRTRSVEVQPPASDHAERSIADIFDGFHRCACELRGRRAGRPPLSLADEYDVQYLLHSLLSLHFEDVRPEEWTKSHAGAAADSHHERLIRGWLVLVSEFTYFPYHDPCCRQPSPFGYQPPAPPTARGA